MPINTVTTAIVPASQVKAVSGFDAQGATGTTQAIAYWFNSASPANSLVFAAVGGVVNVWRTDVRTTTALTGATRLGEFRQGSDSVITDLKFTTSGTTGYLLIAGNTTNVWCYAIDLTTIASISSLGGEAIVQVSSNSSNTAIGSTALDLNFGGNSLYAPSIFPASQQFRTPLDSTVYQINSSTIQNFGAGTISQATGSFNGPYGVAYAPAAGARGERLYVANLNDNTVSILDPTNNTLVGTISAATGSFNGPFGVAYAPAAGARGERLYVSNFISTVSVLDPTNNTLVGTISQGTGSFQNPYGIAYAPAAGARGERLYIANLVGNTVSVLNPVTNTLASGFALRINFDRLSSTGGLSTAVSVGTPIIFVGPFYTPRLRFLAGTSPKLAIDTTNNFLLSQNTSNIFLYRNIDLSSFNGTSNVTVNSVSIPPFTSTIGYYNISTPAAVLTAITTNIAFYYKATNAYILATLGTHQWIIYRLNADTLSSTIASPTTPTIAVVFSTNTLSASSLVRDVAFAVVGSNLVVLAVGTSVNLLYRFATTAYDSTSNTAVAASGALIQFPHGQATTAGRLAAIYHNTSTGRTVFYSANAAGTSIYDLNLTSFTGSAAVILKALSVTPSANQYALQDYHANGRIPNFATLENSNYDPATIGNSTLAGLAGTFALSTLNRANTELVLLSQRFLPGPPALTKASASAPITLATEVDSYQALNILSTASQFLSLGTDTYSSGEYYPWNYLATDDTAGTLSDSFTFSSATAGITGNYRITMASGTTTTLSSKGTYNDSFTLLSGATLALTANTTLTTEFILSSGVSVVRAAGAPASVTLTIPYADPGLSLGSGVSLSAPQPLTITNLISNSRVRVTRVDTSAELAKTLVTGTSVSFAITYQGAIRVEARNASGATAYKPWVAVATLAGTPVTLTASQEVD